MTIKEIAELCGIDRTTVLRWVRKAADDPLQNAQGFYEKLAEAEKSGTTPADFTLEETFAIIGEGGGNKTLAVLLAENVANKNAITAQTNRLFRELTARLDRLEAALLFNQERKAIEDPQEKQYAAIRQFLVENLNITGRRRDFVDLPDLWRRFNDVMKNMPLNMNALLFAVNKIRLDGITVVNKGAFRGLHGCLLASDDEY